MAPVRKVVLDEAAAARPEYWSQEVVGEANGSLFKVAKGTGATEWHAHADQDEVFVVTGGTLVVELRYGRRHAGGRRDAGRPARRGAPPARRGRRAVPHRRHGDHLERRGRQAHLERTAAARRRPRRR